jgi:hypothetical protein
MVRGNVYMTSNKKERDQWLAENTKGTED